MAKANEALPAGAPAEFPMTLSEFCARQSGTDKRVELIGAFNHVETAAGRTQDTERAYAKRFSDFANQPA